MRCTRNWANKLAALCLATLATAAGATPPQVVSVKDMLFARTGDTLILLRNVTDNHGLHTVLQIDTMVVTKSLDEGDDIAFRMVARVLDLGQDAVDNRVTALGPDAPFNPYAVFADGAWPLLEHSYSELLNPSTSVRFDDTGLVINRAINGGDAQYVINDVDVAAQISTSLAATRFFAPLERVGVGTTGPDPFDPMLFDPDRDCTVLAVQFLYDSASDPALAQLHCEDHENGTQSATLWLVVPLDAD